MASVGRHVILDQDESGSWVVECPSLPGCISQGGTREQAIENVREAIGLYIECLEEEGREVPGDYARPSLVAV
jgi:predicted RNase H-like HicB family nuclease